MSTIRNLTKRTIKFTIATPTSNQAAWEGILRPRESREYADGKNWEIDLTDVS